MQLNKKLKRLKDIISGYGSVLVAFSAGVDSTFLLKVASMVLPRDKLLAVTANSLTYPKDELRLSRKTAKEFKVRHKVINTFELNDARFKRNPLERCYFCKKELFGRLKKICAESGLNTIADASSLSDKDDFRPGEKARQELRIRSPLVEAGLFKEDIRFFSRQLGLKSWNKPSQACLASRFPYGTEISSGVLSMVANCEKYLKGMGFGQVRVRHYGKLCRIEVPKYQIPKLVKSRDKIVDKFKKLGYNYVTIDLQGFRSGSLNEVIKR